jgi:hypothetical protein
MVCGADAALHQMIQPEPVLINYVRRGEGKSLLLVHGLGSS